MTTQEAYERIHEFFTRPGAVLAEESDGQCVYRAGRDRYSNIKCAVGCLVPNTLYYPQMEECTIDNIDLDRIGLSNVDFAFLREAQRAHDNSYSVDVFLRELYVIAKDFGLELV